MRFLVSLDQFLVELTLITDDGVFISINLRCKSYAAVLRRGSGASSNVWV